MSEQFFDDTEWIFTFGCGHKFAGKCVRLSGTYEDTRNKMFEMFGSDWGFQYPASKWEQMETDEKRWYPMEKEVPLSSLFGGVK